MVIRSDDNTRHGDGVSVICRLRIWWLTWQLRDRQRLEASSQGDARIHWRQEREAIEARLASVAAGAGGIRESWLRWRIREARARELGSPVGEARQHYRQTRERLEAKLR